MKNTAKWSIQSLLAAMGALGTVLCFTSAFSVSISVPVVTLLSVGSDSGGGDLYRRAGADRAVLAHESHVYSAGA